MARSATPPFIGAGFECASQRRADGIRLDLTAASQHDRLAAADFSQVREMGLHQVRDGVRWHLVERSSGRFDWCSFLPMLHAAIEQRVSVIWDLCHFGWPDHLDVWSAAFVDHFAAFSKATARLIRETTDTIPYFCPINEMSYLAWAGGHAQLMNPGMINRADELKRQLARAYIASVEAIREVDNRARFLTAEPLIHVEPKTMTPADITAAQAFRASQFQAVDLVCGRLHPEIGGRDSHLDLMGVNYYPQNQWFHTGSTIPMGHHQYRALHRLLQEVFDRYGRPLRISETGAEGSARPYWFHHVCAETLIAMRHGVPVEGIYWYPILDNPGWDDERICDAGLLSMPRGDSRTVYEPLLKEMARQRQLIHESAPAFRLIA